MKKLILLSIITIFASLPALAKRDDTVTLKVGQQKTVGKITVRFVAIDSDSRCPANVNCIWAGNARVKISVWKGRKRATSFELNSMLDPKVATFEGYDIQFVDLTPHPGEENMPAGKTGILRRGSSKTSSAAPGLTLTITKHV